MPLQKAKNVKASGDELRALMTKYNLAGNDGAKKVAELLRLTTGNVFMSLSRGLRRNDLELLEYKLKDGLHKQKAPQGRG